MFLSERKSELFKLSEAAGDGIQAWPFVSLIAFIPFFIVVTKNTDENGEFFRETLIMTTVNQLLEIQNLTQILQVSLVSPDLMNKQGEWQTNLLTEIIQGVKPDTEGETSLVYALENGQRYIDSIRGLVEADLLNTKVVFKARNKSS